MRKFNKINESAARLPNSVNYWTKKGKKGKVVALYTHDDLDGLACAIEMKKWLLNNGFTIEIYGILNYMEGWKYTTVHPDLINIVLDFANMPGDSRDDLIDYYLDHHGDFNEFEKEKYKSSPVQKKKTGSAYEALCQTLGVPMDELTVSVVDMVDSAKYTDYGVSWQRLLDFNLADIKKSEKTRLEFGAAFNQFIKRSDTKTLVSVIENCKDASIYSIYNVMKKVYGEHNVLRGKPKDFIKDGEWRLGEMQKRTRGSNFQKEIFKSQKDFINKFTKNGLVVPNGYQIIGDLVFVPSGTWANALRARTIIEKDFKNGFIPVEPKFILLQYGSTLQVCSYKKLTETEDLPKLRDGSVVDNLGTYMGNLLSNFKKHLGYYDPDTTLGQDEVTVSGGHTGIGTISNIIKKCEVEPYNGLRYIDMFKNKIINDLSGVVFNLGVKWSDDGENKGSEPGMDNKVIKRDDVTKLDKYGKVVREDFEYNIIDKEGKEVKVSKEEYIKAGSEKAMKTKSFTMDNNTKRIVAKFEDFVNQYKKDGK